MLFKSTTTAAVAAGYVANSTMRLSNKGDADECHKARVGFDLCGGKL